jgi:replicative DNA helicase Mcm
MTIHLSDDDDNNNQFEIPLKPSKILEDSKILDKLVIDKKDNFVKLRLNTKYNPPIALDVPLSIIKEKNGWEKFVNKFRDLKKIFKIDSDHCIWIYSTINENGGLIRNYLNNNNHNSTTNSSSQQQQEPKQRHQSDVSDTGDANKNTNEEKNTNIEKLSVSQAIQRNSGRIQVTGTITGITKISKMISKVRLYCDKCAVYSECDFTPIPAEHIRSIRERCVYCERLIRSYNIEPLDHKSSIIIELQDTNSVDDLDSLTVYIFDKDTEGISKKMGENAEVIGEIKIVENNFKYYPYLYCESIRYLNKENYEITDEDKEKIIQFNEKHKNTEGGVIKALVKIFDLSIVECDVEKEGILYADVNTSTKIGKQSEHIDILLVGPPGLVKTGLMERGADLVLGSNKVGGQYATGKSFTAIVEKTENRTMIKLGSIPRSYDAVCGINELAKLTNFDLDKLYDVMSKRSFDFEKLGLKANIKTPTTIIATANPTNSDNWKNNEKVDFDEIPGLTPLKDRFGLIFIFRKRDKKQNDEFADKWAEVEARRERGELPDYTEFLIKYLQYAKKFEPVLSDEARYMLKEYYKEVSATGFGSPRVQITLNNLAKAIARLRLKTVVDEDDAKKAQEFYNIMLQNFQKSVVYSESIKDLAYKKGVEIVKRFENFGISLEDLFKTMCEENKQFATYFGYDTGKPLEIKYNHRTRNIKELLLNNSHIKKRNEHPIVLKWFSDTTTTTTTNDNNVGDTGDMEIDLDQEKNGKKNCKKNEFFNENGQESTSPTSPTSPSNIGEQQEESTDKKGFQFHPKGEIHEISEEQYRELNGENIN